MTINCSHTEIVKIPNPYKHLAFDPDLEPDFIEDIRSIYDDIDLHRAKCRKCGDILYYSGAAKRYYENGIRTPGVRGLE